MFDMLQLYLLFSLILYILGIYTLASNRKMVKLVIGIEILVAAVNLNFLAFGAFLSLWNIHYLFNAIHDYDEGVYSLGLVLSLRDIRHIRILFLLIHLNIALPLLPSTRYSDMIFSTVNTCQ